MFYGFYSAASGMLNQQKNINVLGNNLTNSQTPGFRGGRLIKTTFEQALMQRIDKDGKTSIGTGTPIQLIEEVDTLLDCAALRKTDRPFDMALTGYGFFTIKDNNEKEYLTRNGNFRMDEDGYLELDGMGRVMGQDGEIKINSSNFTVEKDGSIYDKDGDYIDTILVSNPKMDNLQKFINGAYTIKEGLAEDYQVEDFENMQVIQNSLERSNINVNLEIARLMESQRSFQSCSQALKSIDQINQKTVSQIASL